MSASGVKSAAALVLLLLLFPAPGASAPPPHAAPQRSAPPRRLRIGASVYLIELVEKVPPAGEVSGLAGKACDANAVRNAWCTAKGRIYLESGRTLQQERTTLLHEIQHILLGTETSDDDITAHQFIYKLSPKLLQVLQDNPELYSYLTAPAPK